MKIDITITKNAKIQPAQFESIDVGVSMSLKDIDVKDAAEKTEILSQLVSKQMMIEQATALVDHSIVKKPNFVETFKQLAEKFTSKITELFNKLGE